MKIFLLFLILYIFFRKIKLDLNKFDKIGDNLYFISKSENKREFKRVLKLIRRDLKFLCRDSINKIFYDFKVKKSAEKLWIYFDLKTKRINTFVIAYKTKKKSIYIDLFCSNTNIKYFGSKIFTKILNHIKKLNYDLVILKASEKELIKYYNNFGFERYFNACKKKKILKDKKNEKIEGFYLSLCLK